MSDDADREDHEDRGDHDDHADHGDGEGAEATPRREEFRHDPVGHASVGAGMSVADLVEQYGRAGIGAADLHEAVDVTAAMFDEDVTCFMGLAGAMVPTGMRALVTDLVREGHVDALVTTGANLTHDAIEAIGGKHHHGRAGPHEERPGAPCSHSSEDSREHGRDEAEGKTAREHDEQLRDEQVDRIYNVYLPQEHFAAFEGHLLDEVFPPIEDGEGTVSIAAFTRELGRANAEVNDREGIEEDAGIAAAAYEHDVPIYCPAIQDSVLGLQAWLRSQVSPFGLDALADMSELNDLAYEADRTGAFVVGGGVPKNYVLQTMLVTPGAYDYAVQLTMDPPQTGGLSGATLDEARSWGKLEKEARNVSVYADATITLPLVVAGALDRLAE
ncbi:deoxyhypusine synthase [Halomarina litorea]|uniref:deoxyhypusine synthase n=1 Tax=Halomarina litorea TaxID=2961595 RepID=UPI0020C575E7|nr:deoxyhypusine synthase [Halomarina sp. BCD28]